MSNLYTFSKKALHCKAFHWLWGKWPHKKFNTMCPYFWAWVGTIIILPVLLILKALVWVVVGTIESPLGDVLESASNKCEAHNKARKLKNAIKKNTILAGVIKAYWEDPTLENAKTLYRHVFTGKRDSWGDSSWNLELQFCWDSKAYQPYLDILGVEATYDAEDQVRRVVRRAVHEVDEDRKRVRIKAKADRKAVFQARKEKAVVVAQKPPSKIMFGIVALAGIGIAGFYLITLLLILGAFIWQAVTWVWANALLEVGIGIGIVAGVCLLGWTLIKVFECWGDAIGRFFVKLGTLIAIPFKYVGKGVCKLGFLGKVFRAIGNGIVIFCDMIYATYKQYCPMITWTNEEETC